MRPQPTITTRVSPGIEGQHLLNRRASRVREFEGVRSRGVAPGEVRAPVQEPDDVEGVEGRAAWVERFVDLGHDLEIVGIVNAQSVPWTIQGRRGAEIEQAVPLGVSVEGGG